MSRFFRWCMRWGAVFLFAFAIVQFFVGLIPLVSTLLTETGSMARNHSYSPDGHPGIPFSVELQILFQAVSGAAFPFFGALLIDRFDQWLSLRVEAEAAE